MNHDIAAAPTMFDHRPGPSWIDVDELTQRYVALWMEPDPAARRRAIRELWRPDGAHVLVPPEDVRESAARVGFRDPTLALHGYDALEQRVAVSYDEFIAPGEFAFRSSGKAARLHDLVLFGWTMVTRSDGQSRGGGVDALLLDEAGKIRVDYQFPGFAL